MKLSHLLLVLGAVLTLLVGFLLLPEPNSASIPEMDLGSGLSLSQDAADTQEAASGANLPGIARAEVAVSSATENGLANLATASIVVRILDGQGNAIPKTKLLAQLGSSLQREVIGFLALHEDGLARRFADADSGGQRITGSIAADGLCTFADLAPGDWRIDLGDSPWLQRTLRVHDLRSGEQRNLGTLYLTPATQLRGRVVNAAGQGLAKVTVSANPHDPSPMRDTMWSARDNATETETDAVGEFLIPNLAAGPYQLRAALPGLLPGKTLALASANPETSLILLEVGAQVRGQVLDLQGKPLAGVLVLPIRPRATFSGIPENKEMQWQGWDQANEMSISTDDEGFFVIQGLVGDGNDGLVAQFKDTETRAWILNVRPGESVEIRFQPETVLTVQLLDQSDNPVAGHSISVYSEEEPYPYHFLKTDDQGKGRWSKARPGTIRLETFTPLGSAEGEWTLKAGVENQAVLKLVGQETMSVLVTNSDGIPLEEASVKLSVEMPETNRAFPWRSSKGQVTAKTDSRGVALFRGFAGMVDLQVSAEGYATTSSKLEVATGTTQEHMVSLDLAGSLQVLVSDASGVPQTRVALQLKSNNPDPRATPENNPRATTDSSGVAFWSNLRPGMWDVFLPNSTAQSQTLTFESTGETIFGAEPSLRSFAPPKDTPAEGITVEIAPGETLEANFVVEKMGLLTVQMLRHGAPVPGVSVQWANQGFRFGQSESSSKTDGGGYLALSPRQPGSYQVEASASTWAPPSKHEVNLKSGPQSLVLELPDGRVLGSASGIAGPVFDAVVSLVPQDSSRFEAMQSVVMISSSFGSSSSMTWHPGQGSTRSNSQGNWKFEDVPAGTWKVQIQAKGYSSWESEPFSHDGGEAKDLGLIQLREGSSLSGHIYGLPRQKKETWGMGHWASLMHRPEKGESRQKSRFGQIGSDGQYFFGDLAPGRYQVQVNGRGQGKGFTSKTVRVGEGPKVLDISLPR